MNNSFKFNSLDQFYADVSNIEYFKMEEVKSAITNILNYNRVKEIRDNIAATLHEMEHTAITNQNIIQFENCYDGYVSVVSNLVDIVINNNFFYRNVLTNLPRFEQSCVDYYEVSKNVFIEEVVIDYDVN